MNYEDSNKFQFIFPFSFFDSKLLENIQHKIQHHCSSFDFNHFLVLIPKTFNIVFFLLNLIKLFNIQKIDNFCGNDFSKDSFMIKVTIFTMFFSVTFSLVFDSKEIDKRSMKSIEKFIECFSMSFFLQSLYLILLIHSTMF